MLVQILDKALHIMDAERGFLMLTDLGSDALRVHVARDRGGDITGVEREEVSRSLMERVRAERRGESPVRRKKKRELTWTFPTRLAR